MPKDASAARQRLVIELDKQLLKRIDHISVDWDYYRKGAIERLLEIAVAKVEEEGPERFLE